MSVFSKLTSKRVLIPVTILVIILTIGAVLLINNIGKVIDNNKDYILSQVEQSIGREVSVEKIDATLWGGVGIRMTNFSVMDDPEFSSETFLTADDLQINLKLLPLIQKKIDMSKLILHNPIITLIRDEQGEMNVSTLGKPETEKETPVPQTEEKQPEEQPEEQPGKQPELTISQFTIDSGLIHFIDKKEDKKLDIKQVDLSVEDFNFDQPFTLNLSAAVLEENPNIEVQSQIGPLGQQVTFNKISLDGEFTIDPLQMDQLKSKFPVIENYLPQGLNVSGPLYADISFVQKEGKLSLPKVNLKTGLFSDGKQNMTYTGSIDSIGPKINTISFQGDLNLDSINLDELKNFSLLKKSIPEEFTMKGFLSSDLHLEGNLSNLNIKGSLNGKESNLEYAGQFKKPEEMTFQLDFNANYNGNKIAFQNTNIQLNKAQLKGQGEFVLGKIPTFNFSLDSKQLNLTGLKQVLPPLERFNPDGQIELHASIQKTKDTPEINGTLKLNKVKLSIASITEPITNLNGPIQFKGNTAETDELTLNIGKSSFEVEAEAAKLFPYDITYTLNSPKVYLADIVQTQAVSSQSNAFESVKSDGRIWLEEEKLSAQGNVLSTQGTLYNIPYEQLKGDYVFKNYVFTIDNLTAQTLSGTLKGQLNYDLNPTPPEFSLSIQTQQIDVAKLFSSSLVSIPKNLQGLLNTNLSVSGKGTDWETIKPSLTGNGKVEIVDGVILDTNIAEGVLGGITSVPGLTNFISPELRNRYPKIFDNKNTVFEKMTASIKIDEGKINFGNLLLAAADWAVGAEGWVNFEPAVDAEGVLRLSKGFSDYLTSKVNVMNYLADDQNRVSIPFSLNGNLPGVKPKPKVNIVENVLQNALKGKAADFLQKEGLSKILPFQKQKAGTSESATKQVQSSSPEISKPTTEKKGPAELIPKVFENILKKR